MPQKTAHRRILAGFCKRNLLNLVAQGFVFERTQRAQQPIDGLAQRPVEHDVDDAALGVQKARRNAHSDTIAREPDFSVLDAMQAIGERPILLPVFLEGGVGKEPAGETAKNQLCRW